MDKHNSLFHKTRQMYHLVVKCHHKQQAVYLAVQLLNKTRVDKVWALALLFHNKTQKDKEWALVLLLHNRWTMVNLWVSEWALVNQHRVVLAHLSWVTLKNRLHKVVASVMPYSKVVNHSNPILSKQIQSKAVAASALHSTNPNSPNNKNMATKSASSKTWSHKNKCKYQANVKISLNSTDYLLKGLIRILCVKVHSRLWSMHDLKCNNIQIAIIKLQR